MIDHLSFSSISKYLKCHRQWKHKYIDGWEEPDSEALLFGKVWHEMIRYGIEEKNNNLLDNWYVVCEGWNDTNAEIQQQELIELGEKMLFNPVVSKVIKELKPMPESIERKFDLHIPGVEIPVIGYIDMIEENTMIPIDFKTASKKWSDGQADSDLQATFYIAAMEQAGMIKLPHAFKYIIFTKTSKPTVQIIETERTAAHVFELHEMINDVWQAIKSKSFGKCDPGMWWCSEKWCGFYDRCKG